MALNTKIRGKQLNDAIAGNGLSKDGSENFQVNVDDSSLEIATDALKIKASGVTNAMLAGSIADGKLTEDYIKTSEVDGSSIEFAGSTLNVKALGIATSMLANDAVDKTKINADIAGLGLSQAVGGEFDVNVDESSIEITTDTLNVKASGITNAMLAGSITDGKLTEDYIKTSEVDGTTIEFAGSTLNIVANGVGATEIDLTATYDYSTGTVQVGVPVAGGDVTNKTYVDNLVNGLQWKEPVRVKGTVADGNIVLSGISGQSLDSVAVVDDDRVLLTEQTSAIENGIWLVKSGAWVRPTDFPTGGEAVNATCLVSEGTDNADTQWTCTTNASADTIDTNTLTFTQISGTGSITAGDGLLKTGNTLDVRVDNSSIEISADILNVKASGITNAMLAGSIADGKLTEDYIKTSEVDGSSIEFAGSTLNVKALGIATSMLANDAVDKTKINADIAGLGLSQAVGGEFDVNVDDSSIEISTDTLRVKASGITNGMLAGSIADGKLTEDYIKTSEVDGSSIEFAGSTLNVKASGITNAMLAGSIADAKLATDYIQTTEVDGSSIEFSVGTLNVKASGVTNAMLAGSIAEGKLDISNGPTNGQVLGYSGGQMTWVSGTAGNVNESDIQVENESANCNGATVAFTLTSTPLANSLQVFLNGLLQENGSGKDYTISGTTVTFADAPLTGDILLIHYTIDN